VEVEPFLSLHAGTQTISQTSQQRTDMFQKKHPQEAHPPHIHYQDGGQRQCAPGPSHKRKSRLSQCLHHSTHPTEELIPLPQHHNQASMEETYISMKMIPFGARHPFLINHHNILVGRGGRLGILC
jgi:hypothetical protein